MRCKKRETGAESYIRLDCRLKAETDWNLSHLSTKCLTVLKEWRWPRERRPRSDPHRWSPTPQRDQSLELGSFRRLPSPPSATRRQRQQYFAETIFTIFAVLLAIFAQWLTSFTFVCKLGCRNFRRLIVYQSFEFFKVFEVFQHQQMTNKQA